MHVITTANKILFWWWLSTLSIKIIQALNTTDFGLPNKNSCAFYSNSTIYIFNQENYSLSISFGNPWNTTIPTIVRHNITTKSRTACSITRSGKIILLQQQLLLQQAQQQLSLLQIMDKDDITLQSLNNSTTTFLGSQNAIDTFITNPNISNFAATTFNDFIIIFGGETTTSSNKVTLLQSTYILDTRYSTQLVWYELPIITTTPPPTSNSTLYSTSRWILHFRTEPTIQNSSTFTTFIDCFDPYGFQWLGTLSSFSPTSAAAANSTTMIQAVPVVSSATGSESLLLFPSWSLATQEFNEFWKLDISTWNPSNFTLTKLNMSSSSSILIHQFDAPTTPASSAVEGQQPIVVTLNNNDMAMFYGGSQQQLRFFNTSSLSFSPQPQWLNTADATPTTAKDEKGEASAKVRNMPIILGSVIGGVLFIALVILPFWCFCYKKRRKNSNSNTLLRPIDNNNNKEKPSLPWPKKLFGVLLGNSRQNKPTTKTTTAAATEEAASAAREENNNNNIVNSTTRSSHLSQYTLSPIKPLSPIMLFPLSSHHSNNNAAGGIASFSSSAAAAATAALQQKQDEGIVQPQQQGAKKLMMKSRFREDFDYQSWPLCRHGHEGNVDLEKHVVASKSLPLADGSASSSSAAVDMIEAKNEAQQEKTIPRSKSSYA